MEEFPESVTRLFNRLDFVLGKISDRDRYEYLIDDLKEWSERKLFEMQVKDALNSLKYSTK